MIISDLHNDTAYRLYYENKPLKNGDLHINLENQRFSKNLLFYAIYMNPEKLGEKTPKKYFEDIYFNLKKEIEKNSDEIVFYESVKNFSEGKKHNALVTLEGGELIEDVSCVDYLYNFGVKAIGLTWNFSNRLASSHTADFDCGLTAFGREIVLKAEEKGILIDLSHASDKTFFDTLKISRSPVLVSHSNSREIYYNTRNITDEMFFALIKNGGLLGINFFGEFLGKNPTVRDIIKHIEHFLKLGGENNIALGSDFDGMNFLPDGIKNFSSLSSLYELLKKEFSEKTAEKIMHKNVFRILSK